eukprot:TRINITY_DN34471_c1_g1_i1.p1 TRINITY_DN34471_c1_g1~~TRINITY_DN34471_c1_g1_i1.p1  ORF type:complete len:276 (-),score=31.60 TRINITY_DN34471_c1_g1_i1:135-908(-)
MISTMQSISCKFGPFAGNTRKLLISPSQFQTRLPISTSRRQNSPIFNINFQKLFGGNSEKQSKWVRRVATDLAPAIAPEGFKLATFAGGCFWGIELAYQRVPGVMQTYVGYTQGNTPNPSYEQVCSGTTGHTEAVQVVYNPSEVGFDKLLETFFGFTDPTTLNRQGGDVGTQYRSGIYYHDEEQKALAEQYIKEFNNQLQQGNIKKWRGQQIVAELKPATDFYVAEKYHQQYLSKGGRFGLAQSAEKGCSDAIRCYG